MASNFWLARTQDWWVLQSFSFALPEPMGSTPNHDGCKGRFCGGNPTWNSPSDHRKVAGSPSKGRQRTDIRVLCESWRLINEPYFLSLSWTHQMHPNAFRWHHLWLCPRSKSEILCSKAGPTSRTEGSVVVYVVLMSYLFHIYILYVFLPLFSVLCKLFWPTLRSTSYCTIFASNARLIPHCPTSFFLCPCSMFKNVHW